MLISSESLLSTSKTQVLPLGDHDILDKELSLNFFRNPEDSNNTGSWATLGWKDDRPFLTDFDIQFSKEGQFSGAQGATLKEIEKLYQIYPEIDNEHPILERYINLDDLRYTLPDEINKHNLNELRLDLHLKKEEGALVFIQYTPKGKYNDDDAFVEYVAPEKTYAYRYDTRNKLSFNIPYLTSEVIRDAAKSAQLQKIDFDTDELLDHNNQSFIVKVLTFLRKAKKPEEVIKTIAKSLQDPLIDSIASGFGKKNYAIRRFDKEKTLQQWEEALVDVSDEIDTIDFSANTLLLIHGTFKDSNGTFEDLLNSQYKNTGHNYLHHLVDTHVFDQIIAFDHPYFWDTVVENQEWLVNKLAGKVFDKGKLKILAASRGGLLAYHLATSEANNTLNISEIMTFSSGSSGYMNAVNGLAKMFSIMKENAPAPFQKFIVGLVSSGLNYVHKSSGLNILKPRNKKLTEIYKRPLPANIEVKIMAADWHRYLIESDSRWGQHFKRAWRSSIDFGIKVFLGNQHDWVIGTEKQMKYDRINEGNINVLKYRCTHGKYFLQGFPKSLNHKAIDIHQEIEGFFKN